MGIVIAVFQTHEDSIHRLNSFFLISDIFVFRRSDESAAIADYVYHTVVAPPSGEIAFLRMFELFGRCRTI